MTRRVALTASEKQRRYRQRRDEDPERRNVYLQREKEKYIQDKEVGRKKLIHELSERGKRSQRKRWRDRRRAVKQRAEITSENVRNPTVSQTLNLDTGRESSQGPIPRTTSNETRSMKKTLHHQQSMQIKILERQLEMTKKKAEMYRKRWEREMEKQTNRDTPKSKTRKLLRHFSNKKVVEKTLLFHHCLIDQIKTKYRQKMANKKTVQEICSGSILRKYKLRTMALKKVGAHQKKAQQKRTQSLTFRLRTRLTDFYERDDVSRIVSGQKSTVTKNKCKKQKRLLLDTLETLHQKYSAETARKISYSSFTRARPFWVKIPKSNDRNTCLCKKCENMKLLAEALQQNGVITTSSLYCLIKQASCIIDNKACMYGMCETCKQREIALKVECPNKEVTWWQWSTSKEDRQIKGETKQVQVTVKLEEHGTMNDLCSKFHHELLNNYKKHHYNINNQLNHYRNLKHNLKENECLIHIDFAENYTAKHHKEIQSMHFGASKHQITLHTGYYLMQGMEDVESFCGVSDNLRHDPCAIWAYLSPVLDGIKSKHPGIEIIHFYSDGPSSQYRQKGNFFLLQKEIFNHGFEGATWNFHESGHGKGIPDGIGGALKRAADRLVSNGQDIRHAQEFVQELSSNSKVHLYTITEDDIRAKETKMTLKTIPGTLRTHQVITRKPGSVLLRDVSCTCIDEPCEGHVLKEFSYPQSKHTEEYIASLKGKPTVYEASIQTEENAGSSSNGHKAQKLIKRGGESRMYEDKLKNIQNSDMRKWKALLEKVQKCKGFDEVKLLCSVLMKRGEIERVSGKQRYVVGDSLSVDESALDKCPTDFSANGAMYPVSVRADGDCLPAAGSVFLRGNDKHVDEVRMRVVYELTMYEGFYLNENNLRKGCEVNDREQLMKAFCMYSDEYVFGTALDNNLMKAVFEREVLQIAKQRTYMGIFQLFALASVLEMPIYSLYLNRGNMIVRNHLHRLIEPRLKTCEERAHILWTSTRDDMVNTHWVPNHFVPVIPSYKTNVNTEVESASARTQDPKEDIDRNRLFYDDDTKTNDVTQKGDCKGCAIEITSITDTGSEIIVHVSKSQPNDLNNNTID